MHQTQHCGLKVASSSLLRVPRIRRIPFYLSCFAQAARMYLSRKASLDAEHQTRSNRQAERRSRYENIELLILPGAFILFCVTRAKGLSSPILLTAARSSRLRSSSRFAERTCPPGCWLRPFVPTKFFSDLVSENFFLGVGGCHFNRVHRAQGKPEPQLTGGCSPPVSFALFVT